MLLAKEFNCRQANLSDLSEIVKSLKLFYVHQHLDWENISDQIRVGTMSLCFENKQLAGILSLSGLLPDNPWVKMFAVRNETQKHILWNKLLSSILSKNKIREFYTIAFWNWYKKLIRQSDGFTLFDEIITLETNPQSRHHSSSAVIRPIQNDDLESIFSIDQAAFSPPWQIASNNLSAAISQSKIATVILQNETIAGYLLCDYQDFSAHLSRIAISPSFARKGFGSELIHHLYGELSLQMISSVTINTQASNTASLNLYKKFGFLPTGENIPVFRYDCPDLEDIPE